MVGTGEGRDSLSSNGVVQVREGEVRRRLVEPVGDDGGELVLGARRGDRGAVDFPVGCSHRTCQLCPLHRYKVFAGMEGRRLTLRPWTPGIQRNTIFVEDGRVKVTLHVIHTLRHQLQA